MAPTDLDPWVLIKHGLTSPPTQYRLYGRSLGCKCPKRQHL